jgi:glycosyltransferase involved in cell wall biosynthesis
MATSCNGAGTAPLRVLIDGAVYGVQRHGGINTYFNEVVARLARRPDTAVEVLLPLLPLSRPPRDRRVRLRRLLLPATLGFRTRRPLALLNGAIRALYLRTRPRCVFHGTYFDWAPAGVPQVATVHDMNHELYPERYANEWGDFLRARYREYVRRATWVIAVSQKTKADVIQFYGIDPTRVEVVHHAVDPEAFWPDRTPQALAFVREQLGQARPYLLYVGGRGDWYKNFPALLEVFGAFGPRAGLALVVAGRPWTSAEAADLRRRGLGGAVRLVPHPTTDQLRALYGSAHAFVYPSVHEGFGIPLLEAMACGSPVLASDIAVFREVAGDAALFFDPADPGAIGGRIEDSLDPARREGLVARGLERVQLFSWEKCAEATHQVYLKALAAHA